MNSETFFVRERTVEEVEGAVAEILGQIRAGEFDAELKRHDLDRMAIPDDGSITLRSESGAGLSPEVWIKILVVFGPVAAGALQDVWRVIVLPRLKEVFSSDTVSEEDPTSGGRGA